MRTWRKLWDRANSKMDKGMNWIHLADDRNQWRPILKKALGHQVP